MDVKRLYVPLAVMVGVLLFAAALRIVGAEGYPLWTDEGWSAWATSDPAQVIGIVAADRHPPLYFAALSLWRQAAGDSRIALRFLSIAAGVITVAAVYRIGADWFGRRAGVFAALLLAALPTAVYYAQEVRHYGWLSLFTALAWLVLLRYLKRQALSSQRPSRALWAAYMLSAAALMYTLYFGVFTLAAQAVMVVTSPLHPKSGDASPLPKRGGEYRTGLGVFAAWVAAGVLYLPWVYVILTEQAGILGGGIAGAPNTISPSNLLLIGQNVFSLQIAVPLAGFVIGVWAIARRPSLARVGVLVGGAGLLVLMIGLSLRFDLLGARTLVFLTPPLVLVCGFGLSRLDARIGAALLGVWVALTLAFPVEIQPRLHSDAAARALASAYQPGDAVILEAGWDDNAFAYEIARALPDGAEIVRTQPWTNERTGGAPVVPQIEPVLQAHGRVWVVQWLQAPQVLPFLEAGGDGFHLAQTLDVSAGEYGARFFAPTIQVRLYEKQY